MKMFIKLLNEMFLNLAMKTPVEWIARKSKLFVMSDRSIRQVLGSAIGTVLLARIDKHVTDMKRIDGASEAFKQFLLRLNGDAPTDRDLKAWTILFSNQKKEMFGHISCMHRGHA